MRKDICGILQSFMIEFQQFWDINNTQKTSKK